MTILILSVITIFWAAMFVLPVVAYAALGLKLLRSAKADNSVRSTRGKPILHLTISHA